MYEEIFLFTTNPILDYGILFYYGGKDNMSWSKKYYKGLTNTQHKINDAWFKNMLNYLKDTGILYVPNLKKSFNKKGEEIKEVI